MSLTDEIERVLAAHSEEWGSGDGSWRCGCGHDLGRDDGSFEARQRAHAAAAVEQIAQARATAAVEAFRARAVEAIEAEVVIGIDLLDWELGGNESRQHAARIIRDLEANP